MTLGRKHRKPVDFMPKTVAEAVDRLVAGLSEEERGRLRDMAKEDLILLHHTWGLGIRNKFGLWGENEALVESLPPEHRFADDASMFLIEAAWERLRGGGSSDR